MVGYIHAPAKNRRSGTTMQKQKGRGGWASFIANRETFPGFPAKPFETEEEVEHYVSGETLPCLICGRQFKRPLSHSTRIHGVGESEYRQRFNIPTKFAVCSPDISEFRRQLAVELNKDGRLERGIINSKARRMKRKASPSKITKLGMESHIKRIKLVDNKGVHKVESNCSWHLALVAELFDYTSIEPPEGELSWSGYKKRRHREPELQKLHSEARKKWQDEKRGDWKLEPKVHLPGLFDKTTRCGKENSTSPIDGDVRFVTCTICLQSYYRGIENVTHGR